MALIIGPGDASLQFSLDVSFRNLKAQSDRRALAEQSVQRNGGPAQTDVEQVCGHPFICMFKLDGGAGLLAVITLLLRAKRAHSGFTLMFAISFEFAQQS